MGILKGTGLAIWSDLFKNARIIGLDIDLGHIYSNMDSLCKLGAFKRNKIELYEFDQFQDNNQVPDKILCGDTIDIFIDDGFHSNQAILNTLKCVLPYLSESFLYL